MESNVASNVRGFVFVADFRVTSAGAKAKKFLWDNISDHTKDIIILEANTDVLEKNRLDLQKFIVCERYKR